MRAQLLLVLSSVVSVSGLVPRAAHAADLPESLTDLAFDRTTRTARVRVSDSTQFILRADRDVGALRIEVMVPRGQPEGSWSIRLSQLPGTDEQDQPAFEKVTDRSLLWKSEGVISSTHSRVFVARAEVPRAEFKNWLLVLQPLAGSPTSTAELKVDAGPIDEALRVQWLMQQRATYPSAEQRDVVRRLAHYLTDAEIRYWMGWRGRANWLRVWGRLPDSAISQDMPGPEMQGFFQVGHSLPNGRFLHTDTVIEKAAPK